jgi:hypothetical protein
MALADLDPLPADAAPAGGRFARNREESAASAPLPGGAGPLAVPSPAPSTRDAEVRRAARARQAVVARWLRQLSR